MAHQCADQSHIDDSSSFLLINVYSSEIFVCVCTDTHPSKSILKTISSILGFIFISNAL